MSLGTTIERPLYSFRTCSIAPYRCHSFPLRLYKDGVVACSICYRFMTELVSLQKQDKFSDDNEKRKKGQFETMKTILFKHFHLAPFFIY